MMHPNRFDSITKLFAERKFSRRAALAAGSAGLAATALPTATHGQGATPADPDLAPDADHGPAMLFVQSFQSGTIAPVPSAPDRFTLALEHDLGQTVYFSDRPDRIVGATPTAEFLDSLGFPDDNPPNAALVMETAPGETDIAVVELFNPTYDEATRKTTYEIEVLGNWDVDFDTGLRETDADLAALAPSFGTAHLFIDDCPDGDIACHNGESYVGVIPNGDHGGFCYSWAAANCYPCQPWFGYYADAAIYWSQVCSERFAACNGKCHAWNLCTRGWDCGELNRP